MVPGVAAVISGLVIFDRAYGTFSAMLWYFGKTAIDLLYGMEMVNGYEQRFSLRKARLR